MANTKEWTEKKEEKLAELLAQAEGHPMMKVLRAEKAAAILATRTEASEKIEALKKERDEVLPKLLADRDTKEENFKRAKAALDAAGGEYQTARFAVSSRSQSFDFALGRQEQVLIESADPAIDAAMQFFRDKLDELRQPGKISFHRLGSETNIFAEKVTLKIESNADAIRSALAYCQTAIQELERMKLTPALDLQKIEEMKKGIPDISIFTEYTTERPMENIPPMIIPRFGGAADDDYEQTLLDRVHKKANDFLSKPTVSKPARRR